jgi:hypothetical protein
MYRGEDDSYFSAQKYFQLPNRKSTYKLLAVANRVCSHVTSVKLLFMIEEDGNYFYYFTGFRC